MPAAKFDNEALDCLLMPAAKFDNEALDCLLMPVAKFDNEALDCRPHAYTNNPHNKI